MRTTKFTAIAAAALFTVSLAACGGSDDTAGQRRRRTRAGRVQQHGAQHDAPTMSRSSARAVPPCRPTPANPGSFDAMAKVPVATAASGNPLLSTLVTAVKKAGLVDSLNTAPALTVFAPTNDAFAKIPEADLKQGARRQEDADQHPDLPRGGREARARPSSPAPTRPCRAARSRSPAAASDFKVNGAASVICGNVQTANATVYIIDTVLMPKSVTRTRAGRG